MGSTLKAARIASTAAWSASCSLPRPIWAKAAMAAASVTRTASKAKERSSSLSNEGGRISVIVLSGFLRAVADSGFHGNHARPGPDLVGSRDGLHGAFGAGLGGIMGDHDNGHRLAGGAAALDHALDGNPSLGQMTGNQRQDAGLIQHLEPQ